METVRAELQIQVMVDCPSCGGLLDLLDESDTAGTAHNDEGNVLRQACPDTGEWWGDAHKKFEVEEVECTHCGAVFDVKGLNW